jgi:hypothetical protein
MLEYLDHPYAYGALTLIIVLYGGLSGPKLPVAIKKLFANPLFQFLLFALIVYRGNRDPTSAIIISVAFMFIMARVNRDQMSEEFEKIEAFRQIQMEGFSTNEA